MQRLDAIFGLALSIPRVDVGAPCDCFPSSTYEVHSVNCQSSFRSRVIDVVHEQ